MNDFKVTDVRAIPGDSAFLLEYKNTAVLYDTGFAFTGYKVSENIAKALSGRKLDGILLTHSHYDHAAGTPYILKRYGSATVVAGEYAEKVFSKASAKATMRQLDKGFAKQNGIHEYEDLFDELKVDLAVKDNETFKIGDITFIAIHLPGHTRCSFGYYIEELGLLLSSETLGVYDGKEKVVPSFLIGVDTAFNSIARAKELTINQMIVPHFGLIDKETTKLFLERSEFYGKKTVENILNILKNGGKNSDALDYFKSEFYHGYVKKIYPKEAMELNTNIMIELIKKEKL